MARLTTLSPSGLPGKAYNVTPKTPHAVVLPDTLLSADFHVATREQGFKVISRQTVSSSR